MQRELVPPPAPGRPSVVRIPHAWYIACTGKQLRDKPLARTVLGVPLVLFRDKAAGVAGALLDRCPHRNVPLSLGRVVEGELQCAYHGWRFGTDGSCRHVPGLVGDQTGARTSAVRFPCVEQDGFVWVWMVPEDTPSREPYRFPHMHDQGYANTVAILEAQASVHMLAENALDVPHTAFLHAGWFRSPRRNLIDVEIRRWHDRVEAEYIGEPAPGGLAGRLLAPGGGVIEHWDRFLLPSIAQVEYRLGKNHFVVTQALTPITDFHTRMFAVATFRLPLPSWLVTAAVRPVILHIFTQDVVVLNAQAENVDKFGGEAFASTEVDVLGPTILGLMRQAEKGWPTAIDSPVVRRSQLEV